MMINIVDDEIRKEVRAVFTEEITKSMRSRIDTLLPDMVTKRLTSNYEHLVNELVKNVLIDHMEIATTIFLKKELEKNESFIRQQFDYHIEKVLKTINLDKYFENLLGRNIDRIVDERIKAQLKKQFTVVIKEGSNND